MCKRDLKHSDLIRRFDEFSQNMELVCRHCGFRVIRLIGFAVPFMHGWRKVQ